MSITVDQLFYNAYRDAQGGVLFEQVGLSPDQTEEARQVYNRMVDSWRTDGLLISHISRQLFPLVPGQGDYTMGPGGDFNIDWPERIERAGIVLTSETPQPEYPIYPLTVDEWQGWVLKTQETNWPRRYFHERSWPLGILHLLYVPTDSNQIALYLEEIFISIDATGDALLDFQPGYQLAMETNMAVQLAARIPGSSMSDDIRRLARESKIRLMNVNNRPLMRTTDLAPIPRSTVFSGNRYSR